VCVCVCVCINRGGANNEEDDTFHPFARRRGKVVGDAITLVAVISWIFCICIW
jgi:hypothetical protein